MQKYSKYKKLLDEEKVRLEESLASVGEKNSTSTDNGDWVPTPPALDAETDPVDAADAIEEYVERIGIEGTLEERYNNVKAALSAIANGTYGTCTIGGKSHTIEVERLETNPSADTCILHMK